MLLATSLGLLPAPPAMIIRTLAHSDRRLTQRTKRVDLSASMDRRELLGVAAAAVALAPARPALGAVTNLRAAEDVLVWKSKAAAASSSSSSCSAVAAREAFGSRFVNYLARFLLTYDRPSRQLWRSRAAEIPLSWTSTQVAEARTTQLGEFMGAIEIALCDFTPAGGKWSEPLNTKDAVAIRRLLTLLRSRYGTMPDALRQLALLFSLLPPGAQPTDAIEQLAAEQENRPAREILLIDRGSFVLSEAGLSAGLPAPALPLPAAPLSRQEEQAARAGVPQLAPTGRVIEMVVTSGGRGYDDDKPPLVSITAPQGGGVGGSTEDPIAAVDRSRFNREPWRSGRRAAQARAIVRDGKVVALEILDQGAGYRSTDKVSVVVAPPPRAKSGFAPAATGRVLLEYEVASVALSSKGGGYGSSQDLDVRFFSPKMTPALPSSSAAKASAKEGGGASGRGGKGGSKAAPAPTNFATPSSLELAQAPWSIQSMAAKYGDAVSARSTNDVLVLRPPRATLVLGGPRVAGRPSRRPEALAGARARARAGDSAGDSWWSVATKWAGGEETRLEPSPRPPKVPSAPRDDGVIDQLLALLPPEEGAPIFDPGKPPSPKYPVGVPPRHRFPSTLYESINEEYVVRAPLGLGQLVPRGKRGDDLSRDVSALPTSVSGGVRQDIPLTPGLVARLAVAGGLCSATTRAVTSPIDFKKTLEQSGAKGVTATGVTAEGTAAAGAPSVTAALATHEADASPAQPVNATSSQQPSIWLGIDASIAAGFGAGAGSFGTYEFLKRTIPLLASSVLGPAAPADLYTPILFTACLLQAVAASVCSAPFESARVKIMAGMGAPGSPTTLLDALREVMRVPLEEEAEVDDMADDVARGRVLSSAPSPLAAVAVLSVTDETGQEPESGGGGLDTRSPMSARTLTARGRTNEHEDRLDFGRLWDGLPSLALRELPFGVVKLLVYATTQDALLGAIPAARERASLALVVSLVSGIVAGFCGALVSQPADTIVTRSATGGFGRDVRAAWDDVLAGAQSNSMGDRAKVLYAGVQQRCLSLAIIVTAQFVLFDGLRALLAVSKEDLSLFLDVFEDRLDFYAGWDEAQGAWLDAVENLDADMLF